MTPNKYQQAIVVITREQEKIIGENLSKQLIQAIADLKFDQDGNPVFNENANPKAVLSDLVDHYATLFGQASVEVSKEAIGSLKVVFTTGELPDNLQ